MEQDNSATPSPQSNENNPLESSRFKYKGKGKATTALDHRHGITHDTSSPVRQPEAAGLSSNKQLFGHAIRSLLPHTTRSTSGKKSKSHQRSPLPPAFQAQPNDTTPALSSMSDYQLKEAHIFHSRRAHESLEELVRRNNQAPPAWMPPNDWIVSKKSEEPPSAAAEQPQLQDVGSLASVVEETPVAEPPQDTRKDSALTQGVRKSIASSGEGPSSKIVRGQHPARISRGRMRVRATSKPGVPRNHTVCINKKQRNVILTRKANLRTRDSFMLKNARHTLCDAYQEDAAEWVSEDDTELVRMPASSISVVKIETQLDVETNLLHLSLKTAIPMQPESSTSHSGDSDPVSQSDTHQEVFAGPSSGTHGPAQTTKPPDASRSSGAEEGSQNLGAAKEAKNVVFTLVRCRKG